MKELLAKLAGAKFFSVIELKDAYLQQSVDKETSKNLTIITLKRLHNVLILAFVVGCASGMCQRKI